MPVAFLNQIAAVQGLKPPGVSDIVQINAPAGAGQQVGSALDRRNTEMAKKIIAVNAGPRMGWNTETLIRRRRRNGMRQYFRRNAGKYTRQECVCSEIL